MHVGQRGADFWSLEGAAKQVHLTPDELAQRAWRGDIGATFDEGKIWIDPYTLADFANHLSASAGYTVGTLDLWLTHGVPHDVSLWYAKKGVLPSSPYTRTLMFRPDDVSRFLRLIEHHTTVYTIPLPQAAPSVGLPYHKLKSLADHAHIPAAMLKHRKRSTLFFAPSDLEDLRRRLDSLPLP